MTSLDDWAGAIAGQRTDDFDGLSVAACIDQAGYSWGGPFRVVANDGNDYFVKCLDACPQGEESSLATELVVAGVGRLIGAPICTTSLIRIPEGLAGWEYRPGKKLQAGLAHASLAIDHAEEGRPHLDSRARDHNRQRHVGAYVLYDWCFGWDQQWLYDLDNDRALYSHDHGLYLPPGGKGYWDRAGLIALARQAHPLPDPPDDLDTAEIARVAAALEQVTQDTLVGVLRTVPASWPVSDRDLEDLGWFLELRAPATAGRVRALTGEG